MLVRDWRKISLLILIGALAAFVSLNAKAQVAQKADCENARVGHE